MGNCIGLSTTQVYGACSQHARGTDLPDAAWLRPAQGTYYTTDSGRPGIIITSSGAPSCEIHVIHSAFSGASVRQHSFAHETTARVCSRTHAYQRLHLFSFLFSPLLKRLALSNAGLALLSSFVRSRASKQPPASPLLSTKLHYMKYSNAALPTWP